MIKVKLLDNRFKVFKKIKELEEKLEILPKTYLKELASEVVLNSPVDTGTYMDSHNIGEVGERSSSKGKPQNQPYETHAENALERMFNQIDALPKDTSRYYISNSSEHAWKVEYEYDYAPYTIAKAKSQQLLDEAVKKVGLS